MFETFEHTGGVVSHTAAHAIVQEPVVVNIEGRETELTLDDAKDLLEGLKAAVATVDGAESRIKMNNNGHTLVLGKTCYGMSFVIPSKLGKNPAATDQARIAARFFVAPQFELPT